MNVVLFGASGTIGSRILAELVARGHQVKAVSRRADREWPQGVAGVAGDIGNAADVAEIVQGADAVISSYGPALENTDALVGVTGSLVEGLRRAGVSRLLMVGGAGSLFVAPGVRLTDTPQFPDFLQGIAAAHHEALKLLEATELDWTNLSPAALIEPGERTGQFRLDTDNLVVDAAGNSRISAEDYAVALVDELEQGKYRRQRFTVGY